MQQASPKTLVQPETGLLLACARARASQEEAAIRRMLEQGIDWTAFARGPGAAEGGSAGKPVLLPDGRRMSLRNALASPAATKTDARKRW